MSSATTTLPTESAPLVTDLFTVTIDAVDGATFRARVHLVNPDINHVTDQPTFPTALLAEAWYDQANGFLYNEDRPGGNRYPFSEERGKEIAAGMRLADELAEIFEFTLSSEKALAEGRPSSCRPTTVARNATCRAGVTSRPCTRARDSTAGTAPPTSTTSAPGPC